MLIIGIDPGISGSICFFEEGKILDVVEMPTMTEGKKNKRQVNGAQIYNEISKRIKFSIFLAMCLPILSLTFLPERITLGVYPTCCALYAK